MSSTCARAGLVLLLALWLVPGGQAQDPGPRRFPGRFVPAVLSALSAPTTPPATVGSTLRRGDLRWPGTAVGAVGLGIAGGLSGAAYCGNSENGPRDCTGTTVLWSAGGAAIGGVAGHFIGRLIHR